MKQTMTATAIETRREMLKRWNNQGISQETMQSWTRNTTLTGLVNAMAQITADKK